MKRCALVVRVSTDRQAQNKEGSLTNQLQRLRAHIDYKTNACGENWLESGTYVLKGISGKDSFRSAEFAQLFEDMKTGKVNTILCTALDRISRSVRDFLNFFEILNKYDVEFVCLKQNYDTTSPQGKLFITIMMALAEFEREQTSDRTKEATRARAERGLWNGGQILGYDLDPNRKGYLIVNECEKALVNYAFNTYLKCGSICKTVKLLNENGYRTKEYMSRRNKFCPAKEFAFTSVQHILTNYTYIGKKEVNKKKNKLAQEKLHENERYKIVQAVWEPIISEEVFNNVQQLLKQNYNSKHNVAKAIRHTYILNGGLLWCGKCGSEMEGRCGTGRDNIKYYYYKCKNDKCGFKLPASEIEKVLLQGIKLISQQQDKLEDIIRKTNEHLQNELPQLKQQKEALEKELQNVNNTATGILAEWGNANNGTAVFIKENLDKLAKRRKELENGIHKAQLMIEEITKESLDKDFIINVLNKFNEIFPKLKPYQQKELIKLVLFRSVLSENDIKIALYGNLPDIGQITLSETDGELRSVISTWLPGCNPFHNRSLSPAVKRKPIISTGYQRARRSRHAGSGVDPDFIPLPDFSTSLLLTF